MAEPLPVAPAPEQLAQTQGEAHPYCFVCSGSNPLGLALRCELQPDGAVTGTFLGHCALEGYPGLLHGGVIAALLDGAMTNCLFAHGICALTADLHVRYLAPVCSTEPSEMRAWLESSRHGVFQLRAELKQGDHIKARARSKFMSYA